MKTLIILILIFPSFCFGELLEIDSEFGQNTITVDTETNFAWLDVTVTTYISPFEMAILLQPGNEYYGWRYPTRDELGFLFYESAGLPGTIYNEQPVDNYFGPEYAEIYLDFMEKVGITFPTLGIPEVGNYTIHSTGFIPYGPDPWYMSQGDVGVKGTDGEPTRGCFAQTCIGWLPMDWNTTAIGHWLVREFDWVSTEETSWGSLKSLWR